MKLPEKPGSNLGGLVRRAMSNERGVPALLNAFVGRLARNRPTLGASMTGSAQLSLGTISTILGGIGFASVLGGELLRTQAQELRTSNGVSGAVDSPTGEWRSYSGDPGSMRYSALDQINRENVGKLAIAWRRPALDASFVGATPVDGATPANDFIASPLMIDGVLYSPNQIGLVEAFDPGTGKTIWLQQPYPDEPEGGLRGSATRGVAYWTNGTTRRLFVTRGEYLIALDPATGKPVADWGENGRVFLRPALGPRATVYTTTTGPQVCSDVVMVGNQVRDAVTRKDMPPGNIQAFDVRTGKSRWVFRVIPQPGEFGGSTWQGDSASYTGQANMWAPASVDQNKGLAYLPLSSATSDMYGGHRLGDNLFSDSLVCVKCETGERVWHYQLVHHDLWDFDIPAAPILADLNVNGKPIQAVIQITKQAFTFVFDRVTGQPVWPIEERSVPGSDTPGERTSSTQPFPTKPPPFDRQGVTVDDLIDFTPQLRAQALEIVKRYRLGPLFTPPSIKGANPGDTQGTIQLPGSVGGADIQGGSFDPETGTLYVPSISAPFIADLVPGNPAETNLNYLPATRAYPPGPRGLPLLKPPYGRITAIDMHKGEISWVTASGDGPRDHPELKPLNLPPLGNPGRGGLLTTKTLLFAGEGDPVMVRAGRRLSADMPRSVAPGAGGNKFKAYHKRTGERLWEIELPSGTTAPPMTYMCNGKQYIVLSIGSLDRAPEFVALALP